MTLRSFAIGSALALAAAAILPARGALLIQSTFDQNLDGWSVSGDASEPVWKATAPGSDGGFAEATDRGLGVYWYWSAPSKFLGDRGTAYGRSLKFTLWESDTGTRTTADIADVVLKGDNTTLVYTLPAFPVNTWTEFTVPLVETAGWQLGGDGLEKGPPDPQTMLKVLSNLVSLEIRGEFISGPDTGRLDNVILELSEAPAPTPLPVTSNFDAGDEGWTVFGDAQGGSSKPTYRPTGGFGPAPAAYVEATDNVQGGVWYWNAPAKFLGNVSAALGRSLAFQLQQSTTASQFASADVILEGAGRRLLYRDRYHPNTFWTGYWVPLRAQRGWHVGTLDGRTPTTEEFRETLTLLEALRIRGEYVTGPDTGSLDAVTLGAGPLVTGDADLDQTTTLADAAMVLRIAGGLETGFVSRLLGGDVAPVSGGNFGDGRLNVLDALRIVRYLSGKETVWP